MKQRGESSRVERGRVKCRGEGDRMRHGGRVMSWKYQDIMLRPG